MQTFIARHLQRRSWLSYLLWPLSKIFAVITRMRRWWYIPARQFCPSCSVISVGNITSGGTGKTPVTIWIARYLADQGKKVAVSHRGYKGDFEQDEMLLSGTEEVFAHASRGGDEAYLLATKLPGIPVIAGRNRTKAITRLLAEYPSLDYIILDDSFQHLQVKHDIDVVVFNALGGIGNGFVLPAGILREPLSALKFADFVVYNGAGELPAYLQKSSIPVLRGNYRITRFSDVDGHEISVDELMQKQNILLSGIGLPRSFEETIGNMGIPFAEHIMLPDHTDYAGTLARIQRQCAAADYVITTEKDFAKLRHINHHLPLAITETSFEVEGGQDDLFV